MAQAGDPDGGAVAVLARHVRDTARIVPDEHGPEARRPAKIAEPGNALLQVGSDLGSGGLTVEELGAHKGSVSHR